jgi:hypothetical protein
MAGADRVNQDDEIESAGGSVPSSSVANARPAAHRASHRILLRRCGPETHRTVDAIVVPASRPAQHLMAALDLAATLRCQVVMLCSKDARGKEVAGLAVETPGVRCVAVDLPADYDHRLVRFSTSSYEDAVVERLVDLSLKRNLGLLIARMAGWRSLLFLDDDIQDISPTSVRRAASALGRYTAVGMAVPTFPDNSVVCHAYRRAGGEQDVFVTASALAIESRRIDSFFPRVYNEDWLYLTGGLHRRTVSRTGTVRQLPYAPFANPERAVAEEFGDVLGEGLVGLLHHGVAPVKANVDYWGSFLLRRKQFIARAEEGLTDLPPSAEIANALESLRAAEQTRQGISPRRLHEYVQAWHRDLAQWDERLRALPRPGSVCGALRHLALAETTLFSESRPKVSKNASRKVAGVAAGGRQSSSRDGLESVSIARTVPAATAQSEHRPPPAAGAVAAGSGRIVRYVTRRAGLPVRQLAQLVSLFGGQAK